MKRLLNCCCISIEDKVEWKNIGDPSSGWEAEWDGFGAPVDEGCGEGCN